MLRIYKVYVKQVTEPVIVEADRYSTFVIWQPKGHYFYQGNVLVAHFPPDQVRYVAPGGLACERPTVRPSEVK